MLRVNNNLVVMTYLVNRYCVVVVSIILLESENTEFFCSCILFKLESEQKF